jgi:hypothetical protein
VLAATAAAVLAGVVLVLSHRQPREAGTSFSNPSAVLGTLTPRARTVCQPGENVPGDAASLELRIDTGGRPTPPLTIAIRSAGRIVRRASLPAGPPATSVTIPFRRVPATLGGASVCLTAAGRQPVGLVGHFDLPAPARVVASPAAKLLPGRLAIVYWRPGSESGWSIVPAVWHRFGLGKATWEGSWTMALAIVLVLIAAGTAAVALVRSAR